MNEEGSLFDVPPAAIGRYLVRQPLGTGTTGPVFHGQHPETHAAVAIKLFKVDLSPDDAQEVARSLARLVDQTPRHEALVVPLDAGLDEIEAFFVTAMVEGDSLEAALRDFGPAAIEDLVPRLRSLAEALDAAHGAGLVHGALHPGDILVSPDTTYVTGVGVAPILAKAGIALPLRRPYSAPEVGKGTGATAAADQFSLAALSFEWLFGRRISGPAERLVEVRSLPGVDREALSNAFTIALAPDAETRFDSCRAFADAVAASVEGAATAATLLPLDEVSLHLDPSVAPDLPDEVVLAPPLDVDEDPVEPFVPEPPRFESMVAVPQKHSERFGGAALIATLGVGLLVGFAAGYMARPRALQSGPPRQMASFAGTDASVAPAPKAPAPAPARRAPTPQAPEAPQAPKAPIPVPATAVGRLLVRSSPSGATVAVDGVTRGVTPLALRDLPLGSRTVVVARRGYIAEESRVVLTSARPSRSLELRLTAEATAPAPRPGAARSRGSTPWKAAGCSRPRVSTKRRPSAPATSPTSTRPSS